MPTLINPATQLEGYPSYALAVGDTTTYVPTGGLNSLAWSTTTSSLMVWGGRVTGWVLASSGYTPNKGTTTISFGTGSLEAQATITGQTSLLSTSIPYAILLATDDSGWVDNISVNIINIIAGTGFTIIAKPMIGQAFGAYTVGWVWS